MLPAKRITSPLRCRCVFPLLCFAVGSAALAIAQSPSTFTATGHMATPRFLHTATLLLDGRVLIAGGDSSYAASVESSAELYDPVTGNFVKTGSMATRRTGHTATLLPDGKVLIAGGGDRINLAGYSLASAELYDPATGMFARTGDMTVERSGHIATQQWRGFDRRRVKASSTRFTLGLQFPNPCGTLRSFHRNVYPVGRDDRVYGYGHVAGRWEGFDHVRQYTLCPTPTLQPIDRRLYPHGRHKPRPQWAFRDAAHEWQSFDCGRRHRGWRRPIFER